LKDIPPAVLEMVPGIASKIPQRARRAEECISGLQVCVQFKDLVPPVLDVVPDIAAQIPKKAITAGELVSGLKACVQMKNLVPAILDVVPDIAAQIPKKPGTAEELVSGLEALVRLKEVPAVLDVVPDIALQIPRKATTAEELFSGLKACVQLKDLVPAVLDVVSDIAAQIPKKASTAEELASSLETVAPLKDIAPSVLDSIPDIAAQIPQTSKAWIPGPLRDCLEALVQLQDSVPNAVLAPALLAEGSAMKRMPLQSLATMRKAFQLLQHDFLRRASTHLSSVVRRIRPQKFAAVVAVVGSCARARVYSGVLLHSIAQHIGSPAKLEFMTDSNLCTLLRSYEELDADNDFTEFRGLLLSETARRGSSEGDI